MISATIPFQKLEEIALSLLDSHNANRCRHLSFILYKNRLISTGLNVNKTHPMNLRNKKISRITGEDYSDQKQTCSELNAILKLKRLTNIDTRKCTLINLRYDRNDKIALAKPCSSCQSLLRYHNFKQVIWSTNNGYETH
jgi:deoxycytidylate deaminase